MFIIDYIPKFTEEVLPKLFKHCKFPSFVRQLNIYGFQRDTDARKSKDSKDKESCRWYHPYFHPGRRDLFPLIRRKATQYTRRRRAKLLPEDGQDFHASTSFTTSVEPHLSMYDDSTNDTKPTMAADVNPTDLLRPVITDALPCTILSMTDPALSFSSASSTSTIPLDMQETNQLATPSSSSRSSSSFVDNNADYFCSDPPYQHRASMPHLHPPPPGYSLPAAQPQPWLVQDFAYLNQGYPPWMAPSIPPIDRRSSTLLLQHTSSSHDPLDRPVHDDTKSMHAPVTPPLSSSSSIPQSGASTSPLSPAMPSPLVTLPSSPVANGTAFMSSSAPPPYSSTFLPSASAATFSAHRPSHPAPCLSLYDADLLSFQPRIHPPLPP
ncbi:hypothetical protein DM01DRAFT_302236 [Hesseltinella vesiculosa]|uniref:HSF-type DNA-binding domain-containing protein n=1 Tax=Hesseltinella vesiculosa TaxID=101127 RepID=A0A1X2GK85_9FUNG|nr:hypothetical protein DM01DRAFT_302236 [Hesseltinella vesiculosa]